MFKNLKETIEAYKARDPAARSSLEIYFLYQLIYNLFALPCLSSFNLTLLYNIIKCKVWEINNLEF